jgi:hypothetical protein
MRHMREVPTSQNIGLATSYTGKNANPCNQFLRSPLLLTAELQATSSSAVMVNIPAKIVSKCLGDTRRTL